MNESLLIQINNDKSITYIPVVNYSRKNEIAKDGQKDTILYAFESRSNEIKNSGIIEERYKDFANQNISEYLLSIMGTKKHAIYKIINRLTSNKYHDILGKHYKKKYGLILRNYIECEAHRELIIRGLSE
jgi:poly-gamma-glutamate synthesis protein (capsule biosynthesis protein)